MSAILKVEMNRGREGVNMGSLAAIAKGTSDFLTSLSVDLGAPESDWIASEFSNGSLHFDIQSRRGAVNPSDRWNRAIKSILSNDLSDPEMDARIRPESRIRFFNICKSIPDGEVVYFGLIQNGNGVEWHAVDRMAGKAVLESLEPKVKSYGEIQGIVHAFYKESKKPKLVIRELSTWNLVDCFFSEELYEHVVKLMMDKEGVIFVEGEITENERGEIASVAVKDFTPAPEFDEGEFEAMLGKFPGALTGRASAAQALDEYRT